MSPYINSLIQFSIQAVCYNISIFLQVSPNHQMAHKQRSRLHVSVQKTAGAEQSSSKHKGIETRFLKLNLIMQLKNTAWDAENHKMQHTNQNSVYTKSACIHRPS